jgi:hypothetical protein
VKQVVLKDTYITVELLASGGEWWWGTPPPYYWLYPRLVKGAKEYDVLKKPVVEILDIVYQGQDNRKIAWMKARIKVKKNYRTETYTFKQQLVQVGKTITIVPNNVSVVAQVIGIEGQESLWNPEQVVVYGRLLKVRQWVADAIVVGDTMKDNEENVVAVVLEKKVEQAEIVTETWLGEPLLRRDPLEFDVTVKMRIRAQRDGDMLYFNFYQPVQPGQEIDVQLSGITIKPEITEVKK